MGFIEIFLPMLTFGITILCCSAFCKLFHRIREARLEHDLRPERPSIFVIPLPGSSHDHDAPHRPPRYSVSTFYSLPPPYNEVEMKPDVFLPPQGPPPAYSDVSHSPAFPSLPQQPHMEHP
ncbi:uncharacterized protein si:dkey-283b1.6 [Osmerus mordax]|uniref:uncharacterized protein si:dkey-283b1.6 n=1 Tax=Osmerus mordax TaxID=8014 RepID=UPI003510C536